MKNTLFSKKRLKVLSLTDRNTNNPKNPYTLYQKLKDIIKDEKLLKTGPTTTIGDTKITVALNLDGFRKRASVQNEGVYRRKAGGLQAISDSPARCRRSQPVLPDKTPP